MPKKTPEEIAAEKAQREAAKLAQSEVEVRRLQTEKAHQIRLQQAVRKDPILRRVVAERDALRDRVTELEAALGAAPGVTQ